MKDRLWETRDGRIYRVADMETSHIVRSIRLIQKSMMTRKPWRTQYLERLELELEIRAMGLNSK